MRESQYLSSMRNHRKKFLINNTKFLYEYNTLKSTTIRFTIEVLLECLRIIIHKNIGDQVVSYFGGVGVEVGFFKESESNFHRFHRPAKI